MAWTQTYTGKDQVPHHADKTLKLPSHAFLHKILTEGNIGTKEKKCLKTEK